MLIEGVNCFFGAQRDANSRIRIKPGSDRSTAADSTAPATKQEGRNGESQPGKTEGRATKTEASRCPGKTELRLSAIVQALDCVERLIEIRNDILRILETHGESDQLVQYPDCDPLLPRH